MKIYEIDLSGVTDRRSLHLCLQESFPLPDWYGFNLDALYDVLTDIGEPVCLRFTGRETAGIRLPDYFRRFVRVLEDACSDNPDLHYEFRHSDNTAPDLDAEAEQDMEPGLDAEAEQDMEPGLDAETEQGVEPDRDAEAEQGMEPDQDAEAEQGVEPDRDAEAEQGMEPDQDAEAEQDRKPHTGEENRE